MENASGTLVGVSVGLRRRSGLDQTTLAQVVTVAGSWRQAAAEVSTALAP
jgi:hypothetical protein